VQHRRQAVADAFRQREVLLVQGLLGPADPLRHGGLGHPERRGGLRRGQAADRAQRERDLARGADGRIDYPAGGIGLWAAGLSRAPSADQLARETSQFGDRLVEYTGDALAEQSPERLVSGGSKVANAVGLRPDPRFDHREELARSR
jgi:hypothetical protein